MDLRKDIALGGLILAVSLTLSITESLADFQYRFKVPGVKSTGSAGGGEGTPSNELTAFNPCGEFRLEGQNVCVFTYTEASESFLVPSDRTSIGIKAWGAGGGGSLNRTGGGGGYSEATVPASPDATLQVRVGGGGAGSANSIGFGGFNGGGDGGNYRNYEGAGGGGASDVRIGSILDDRIVVAGGGSGAAEGTGKSGTEHLGFGRGGGGEQGNSEPPCCHGNNQGGGPGGTQINGGNDGIVIYLGRFKRWTGEAGSFGQGGQRSYNSPSKSSYGGGGGGGWYGGAAGNVYSGGGGGSGRVPSGGSTQPGDDGTDLGGGAPGNASEVATYASDIGMGGDLQADGGNGLIVITW